MSSSLWLIPDEPVRSELSGLIASCSKEFGGPVFPPHVTVADVPRAPADPWSALAASRALALSLDRAGFDEPYHHAFYLAVDEDLALAALQRAAVAAFEGALPKYAPHLSLAYGALDASARVRALELLPTLPLTVAFSKLELWDTTGAVSEWTKLAERPLAI